jgi:hypothetical protein
MLSPPLAKLARTLHWISSAFGLACLLFFSVTGVTLNHPQWFSAQPQRVEQTIPLEPVWLQAFASFNEQRQLSELAGVVTDYWGLPLPRSIEHDEIEWVLDYQRPGGVSTVILDLELGTLTLEQENDGAVALINDLHKGRHSGLAWSLLIDGVAILCVFLSLTGLLLLVLHARKRPSTWPWVGAGTLLPLLVYWVFVP